MAEESLGACRPFKRCPYLVCGSGFCALADKECPDYGEKDGKVGYVNGFEAPYRHRVVLPSISRSFATVTEDFGLNTPFPTALFLIESFQSHNTDVVNISHRKFITV